MAEGYDLDLLPNVNVNTIATIYEIDGRYRSWVPGRDLNQFNFLRAGVGYLIIAKVGLDLSGIFAPPIQTDINEYAALSDATNSVVSNEAGTIVIYKK